MANTYISFKLHVIFSTKQRVPMLTDKIRQRLWPYMGGIVKENGMKAITIGGTKDHVHLLLSLPGTMSISKAVQLIKGGSSKWISETFPESGDFNWQTGYGAFSINVSLIEQTSRYIINQEEHHQRKSFREEYIEFLKKHAIDYDERYVFD